MTKKKVLVTGSSGQLGYELQAMDKSFTGIEFTFTNSNTLDITNSELVNTFFTDKHFDYCINCAAFTDVDSAETTREQAYTINVLGVKNLAENCRKHQVILIHISTDYVFDGKKAAPYKETDLPNPINYYGETKWLGEKEIKATLAQFFIIRTSWLYGAGGVNFVSTMLSLANTHPEVKVVADQTGSPTYAKDLAAFILHLIQTPSIHFGVYNFTNTGQTSWYNFAKEIFNIADIDIQLRKIATKEFLQKAQRPTNSSLDLSKTTEKTNFNIRNWKDALADYLANNFIEKKQYP